MSGRVRRPTSDVLLLRPVAAQRTPRAGRPGSDACHAARLRLQFLALCTLFATPLALLALAHRALVKRKPIAGLVAKLRGDAPAGAPGAVVVHGVSLGEVNLMKPLLPRIEAALGARALPVTSTTTGRQALDEAFPGRGAFLPLDLPWAVERFLARVKPRALVLLELEIWPLLMTACAARGIPVALVNARVGEGSFRGYRAAGALTRPVFRALACALAQNPLWGARLRALGGRRDAVAVTGSLKADIVRPATPAQAVAEAERTGLRAGVPVLLVASTSAGEGGRPDEEAVALCDRLAWWRAQGWQVVICPRHPERGPALAQLVGRLGGIARRTAQRERLGGDPGEVLLVDEIGRLGALYAWTAAQGGIAVVGGGLGSGRRGQNMLEAAAAGCCTVVGWDCRNFPDAMALLREADAVVELTDPPDPAALAALAADPARRARMGAAAQRAWRAGQGAIGRTVERLRAALVR